MTVLGGTTAANPLLSSAAANTLEALLGDYQRKGVLNTDDIARIVEKRKLDLDDLAGVLNGLKAAGIKFSEPEQPTGVRPHSRSSSAQRPYFSAEEERRLANVIRLASRLQADTGSGEDNTYIRVKEDAERAREVFISRNQGLVRWVAKRFRYPGLEFDDIVQEGMKGLIRAVEMFDPDIGCRFSTYAHWWIRQSIQRGIDDTANVIRIPIHRLEKVRRLRRMQRRLSAELGGEPTTNRLATALGWSIEKTAFIAELAAFQPVEIDAPMSAGARDTLENVLLRDNSPTPEDNAVQTDLRRKLDLALASLPIRSQDIVRRRFGLNNGVPQTLEQIGQLYGITRERIRQIEESALRMLGKPARSAALKSFID